MRRARCAPSSPAREAAFFFYGTLMDRDLLSQVLGRRIAPRALRPARLLNHRRAAVCGATYPVVLPRRGASVSGVVLRRVKPAEGARLCAYEGEEYELARGRAELAGERRTPVVLFKPKPGAYTISHRSWAFATWRLRYKLSEMKLAPAGGRDEA